MAWASSNRQGLNLQFMSEAKTALQFMSAIFNARLRHFLCGINQIMPRIGWGPQQHTYQLSWSEMAGVLKQALFSAIDNFR